MWYKVRAKQSRDSPDKLDNGGCDGEQTASSTKLNKFTSYVAKNGWQHKLSLIDEAVGRHDLGQQLDCFN